MHSEPIKEITDFIFLSDFPTPCDAIFVAGGSFPALPEEAARFYAMGLAPCIFIGGGYSITEGAFKGPSQKRDIYNKEYKSECEFYADVLDKCGVPSHAVLGEDRSRYTKENAVFAKELALSHGVRVKRAMLICQTFHARRCLMYYQLAFPDVDFSVCPVDTLNITAENWHKSPEGRKTVLGEIRKIGEQFADEIK